jgi:hypothetical protein
MTEARRARTPRAPLFRIGRLPTPAAWPPREYAGSGRFDDPIDEFRVLYASQQRRGAFLETLAPFRPSLEAMAALQSVTGTETEIPVGALPQSWRESRVIAKLTLAAGQRWLDLRAVETRETLRAELASELLQLGFTDLDLSGVVGPQRELTQRIARSAHEQRYHGLVYSSRVDASVSCWAIFEGARFEVDAAEPIRRDDPDLVAVAQLFNLAVD